jgi:hypothetical protein
MTVERTDMLNLPAYHEQQLSSVFCHLSSIVSLTNYRVLFIMIIIANNTD